MCLNLISNPAYTNARISVCWQLMRMQECLHPHVRIATRARVITWNPFHIYVPLLFHLHFPTRCMCKCMLWQAHGSIITDVYLDSEWSYRFSFLFFVPVDSDSTRFVSLPVSCTSNITWYDMIWIQWISYSLHFSVACCLLVRANHSTNQSAGDVRFRACIKRKYHTWNSYDSKMRRKTIPIPNVGAMRILLYAQFIVYIDNMWIKSIIPDILQYHCFF